MPQHLIPINLFDIEANLQHKKLGKTTMKTEEELDALAPEQYGSIKSKAAYIQALNTRLFCDLTRIIRVPETITFADIVSKYGLVFQRITSLSLQRSNIPKDPIICTFITLQNMEYYVRTDFGDSENTYGGDKWEIPLNPATQGI